MHNINLSKQIFLFFLPVIHNLSENVGVRAIFLSIMLGKTAFISEW